MKNFRRLCFVLVLAMAFSVPVFAGDSHSPGAPAPAGDTDPGDGHSPGAPSPGDVSGPVGIAILIAQGLL